MCVFVLYDVKHACAGVCEGPAGRLNRSTMIFFDRFLWISDRSARGGGSGIGAYFRRAADAWILFSYRGSRFCEFFRPCQ
jgi:hypothetical protein